MTQKDKESLKWLLVEAKAIVDTDSQNPYAGIFLNNLCDVVDEFVEIREEQIKIDVINAVEMHKDFTQDRKKEIITYLYKQ